jgi:hypothetical protein
MRVCFNGCSFTVGEGFDPQDRNCIYDRLLSKKFNFDRVNIAKEGSSNYTIFMRTVEAISSNQYNIIFVQWSALNRIWLSPGPKCQYFVNDGLPEFSYRNIHLSLKEKQKFNDTLLLLNHDYQNIFDLIDYCKILNQLALGRTQLVFINGLVPWMSDLTVPLSQDLSTLLSTYSKEILDFDTRDDDEIRELFVELQHKFAELDLSNWVNVFNSFNHNIVDCGPLGHHPGVQSHQWMADQIATFLIREHKL